MKKSIYILFLSICCCLSRAQVPADSLTGVYIGKYWLANPSTHPWVITDDTLYVTSIDTTNCTVAETDTHFFGNYTLYSDYYSCNGTAPLNAYAKFYSGDSSRFITANYPQPPPNPPYSFRFYGKRVGPYHSTGIEQLRMQNDELRIYPNPTSSILNVECRIQNEKAEVQIMDVLGNVLIHNSAFLIHNFALDVSGFPAGVYFVRVGTATQKFIKK